MANLTPIHASEATAAKLLDLPAGTFRQLVEEGALPGPVEIAPGVRRWDVEQLRRIGKGDALDGMEGVQW